MITVEVPGDGNPAVIDTDGSVVYADVADDSSLVVQPQQGGGVRMLTVLDSNDAPDEFDFEVHSADGYTLRLADDGSAEIVDGDGSAVMDVPPAWAFDANGTPVAARYSIDHHTLTLHIDHRATDAYPIIADP
ncbi:MAG: hypothetical protein D6683_13975, partial [Actinomyces sp.]